MADVVLMGRLCLDRKQTQVQIPWPHTPQQEADKPGFWGQDPRFLGCVRAAMGLRSLPWHPLLTVQNHQLLPHHTGVYIRAVPGR